MVRNSPVQYQQSNRLSPPIMNTKHTTICGVCYSDPDLGDAHTCGGVKPCRWIPPFLITGYPPTIQIDANNKYLDIFASTQKDHTLSQIFMTT